jgi:hypothetical protein
MNKEIITVKRCFDCPFQKDNYLELPYCGLNHELELFVNGEYPDFPPGCPLADGNIFVVCRFWNEND